MITKDVSPSSPIGVQWEFQPRSAAFSDASIRATTLDVWSLPLETVMSYGGAVSDFVRDISSRAPIAFRSGEPGAGDPNRWDLVHRSQFSETLNSFLPAYVVFDALKLNAGQLAAFEREVFQESDATVVLPVGTDIIFLKELLTRTRLQLSLDLDHLPQNQEERLRILEMIFKDQLRVSEIRMEPSKVNQTLWHELVFDYSCSAAAILKWSESQTPWSEIRSSLSHLQSLRSGTRPPATNEKPKNRQTMSVIDEAFAAIFPQLKAKIEPLRFKPIWADFLEALGENSSREWEPYGQLRLWPMFLKMHLSDSPELIELAQTEWARFAAEFHPADETTEQLKLTNKELKANPSLQTVRTQKEMIAIVRNRHLQRTRLHEENLDWMSAALIDEINESPKMSEEGLLGHVESVRAPQGPQPSRDEWVKALKKLVGSGLILASPTALSS